MLDPLDFEKRPLIAKLSRKRALTGLVLFSEILAASLWRILSWTALFAGLWLLQIPAMISSLSAVAMLILFIGGLVYFLRADIKDLRWPSHHEIDRRIEAASHLQHRPIRNLEDKLQNPQKAETRALWNKSRDTSFAALSHLKIPTPKPVIVSHDPAALRFLAMLILIVGCIVAGPQWQDRIHYGLFPFSPSRTDSEKISPITLWITPPEYTALPQIILQGGGSRDGSLTVPEDSILKVRVNDSLISPVLVMGAQEIPLEKLGDKSWGIETQIVQGDRLLVKEWLLTKASIAYEYIVDAPPQISLREDIKALPKGEIQIPLTAEDDYGVTDLHMKINLDPMIEDRPLGVSYEETRAVMSPPETPLDFNPVYDLSWHPWAGLPVTVTLQASDHKQQQSESLSVEMTLPERKFHHPVAQKLIEFRKRLIWTPEESASNVAYDLEKTLQRPESFQYDTVVTLALRSAASRLGFTPSAESAARVAELLWDTALRIEEGDLPLAARNLRAAQRHLEQLLKDPNASDEEIAQAMQELRESMALYFQEMYREIQKRMAESGQQMQIPPEMFQQNLNPEDLAAFLDKLQSNALSGDRDAARQMLSQLQQFMDMLDSSAQMTLPPEMQFMMEGVSELQQLIEKQQALKEQTERQAGQIFTPQQYPEFTPFDQNMPDLGAMPPPPQAHPPEPQKKAPKINTQQNKQEQDALRYVLGQLMLEADEQLGEIPENMGRAEQEMRSSALQLGENRPDLSVPHQEKAIQYLQEAMEDMAQQMQQMMQQMALMSFGNISRLDPLGRPMPDDGDGQSPFGEKVKIPDETQRKRVQEILKLLRQRSGEVQRPDYELEYYRRLMKRF